MTDDKFQMVRSYKWLFRRQTGQTARAGPPDRFRIPQMYGPGQFVIRHLSFVMALKGPSLGALALAQRKSC
jgi:hypothetical protein